MGYLALSHFMSRVVGETVDPAATKKFLDRVADYRGGRAAFEGIAEGFSEAIEGISRGMVRQIDDSFTWLKIQDIATSSGFKIKELDQSYRRWIKDQYDRLIREGGEIGALDLRPEVYAERCSHGRPRAILDALMGPNPTPSSRPRIKVSQDTMWPSVFFRRLLTRRTGDIARKMVQEINSEEKLRNVLEAVCRKRYKIPEGSPVSVAEELSFLKNYLARYKHDLDMDAWRKSGSVPDDMPALPDWNSVFDLDSLPDDEFEKVLGNILGNQKIDAEEFIHRVFDAQVILDDVTIATDYHGVQTLWEIPGFHKMLGNVVTRSGYEKGLVFEIEQIIKLRKAFPNDRIILQVNIPPGSILSGPDIILLRRMPDGSEIAEIFQAKSLRSMNEMTGYSGAMFKQTQTDLQRIFKNYDAHWIDGRPHIKLPDGVMVPLSNKWVFQADYLMMREAEEVVARLDSVVGMNESFDPTLLMERLQGKMDALTAVWKNLSESSAALSSLSEVERKSLIGISGIRTRALEAYVAAAPGGITVREVFFAKLACDGGGVIDSDFVTKLMNMRPPLEIKGELIMTETEMFNFWREAG